MKVTLESTTKTVTFTMPDGAVVRARIWEGKTESGITVYAYITRISCDPDADQLQFKAELLECKAPSAEMRAIPFRLII